MKRVLVILAFAATACDSSPAVEFTDVSVTLPEDKGEFPDRPGKDAMIANCAGCHSPSMILTQPRLTQDQWKGVIKKMREVYKAPIDPAAEADILAYLTGGETTAQ
ncbi:MAG TPA: cytochrome c [Sphingorhabdus sp.]|nr:cytochrome c [Sphingorhabdus sp.]